MKFSQRSPGLLLAAASVVTCFGSPVYTLIDLGASAGSSTAAALNQNGQVAGWFLNPAGEPRAFLTGPAGPVELALPAGAVSTRAAGTNDSGQVAGAYQTSAGARAAVWSATGVTALGTLGGAESYAQAINDAGAAAGMATDAAGVGRAFLATGGVMHDLSPVGSLWSAAYSLNNTGQVAGYALGPGGVFRGFTAGGSTGTQWIGTLGGASSYGLALNASGAVAGHASVASGHLHAFIFSGGSLNDLGTLGGGSSYAYGLNAAAHVVGYSWLAAGSQTHAFLYRDGVMADLNDLVIAAGWELIEAYAINDAGQIAGAGLFGGERRAFLLDPVPATALIGSPDAIQADVATPEPSLFGAVAVALAALAARRLRR